MKKILLFALTLSLLGVSNTASAQCTFANPGIRLVAPPYTNAGGQCVVTMELSFDILHNPGGKYFWIHLWPTSAYANYSYPQSSPPTTSIITGGNGALDNSIATLGFFHQGGALEIQTAYPPDINAPNFQSVYAISEMAGGVLPGSDRYTINGLVITLPLNCDIPQSFTADLWESQSAHAQTVACVSKGVVIYANDPKVTGFLFCQTPRTFNFSINTINTGGLSVNYNVYLDNGDGIYNKAADNISVASGSNIQLDNSNNYTYNSGVMSYLPYSNEKPFADRALWVVVTSPSITNEVYTRLDNACIPLPVVMKSFTANRIKLNVMLKWETLLENNNNGFEVERNINGSWENIAFVKSKGVNGNSDALLTYIFTDINSAKGLTQYRIKQIDIDNKSKYSAVCFVKGMDQANNITVYPNPSDNGKVNIVFDDKAMYRDLAVVNANGMIIRQIKNISNNYYTIDNLSPGIYMISIITNQGEKITKKIIIAGR